MEKRIMVSDAQALLGVPVRRVTISPASGRQVVEFRGWVPSGAPMLLVTAAISRAVKAARPRFADLQRVFNEFGGEVSCMT